MSITAITHKLAEQRRRARDERQLARVLEHAPTPASRQELLTLLGR